MRSTRPIRRSKLAVALLALPLSALAGDNIIDVTTESDALDAFDQRCSLREAVLNANTNTQFSPVVDECPAGSGTATDVIVLLPNATYSLTRIGADDESGDLDIANDPELGAGITDLRIQGSNADGIPMIRQTVAGERVIEIAQADVILAQVLVRDGATAGVGGGINVVGGSLELSQSVVMENTAVSGGGIYSTGPVTLDRSALSNNAADLLGGGVMQDEADMTMVDSFFIGNEAVTGGGIYVDSALLTISGDSAFSGNTTTSDGAGIMNADGDLDIDGTLFIENIAGGNGGAVRSETEETTLFENASFVANGAVDGGAMCFVGATGTVLVEHSVFEGNIASGAGGALIGVGFQLTGGRFFSNKATLDGGAIHAVIGVNAYGTVFDSNDAHDGGAIHAQSISLNRVRIVDNAASGDGGGVYADNFLRALDSRITGNTAAGNGAGVWFDQQIGSDSWLIRSLVAGNVTQGDGGGIFVTGAHVLQLANTTISENRAPNGQGSGLYIDGGHAVSATNVTLADNSPGENVAKFGTLELKNSIITTPGGIDCVMALDDPEIDSLGNNLSDDDTCIGLDHVTDLSEVDVLLAPLAWTSSDTLTHALLAGSPALDRGDASTCEASPIDGVDQRGGSRYIGLSCDIGAHEQGAAVSLTMFGDGFE